MQGLRHAAGFVFFLLSISCRPGAAVNDSGRPPNIVVIFTDDQGYRDLGCFGSPDIRTPNIDRMAAEGVRFTNFYVAQPVCSASRAALLTGCYPSRVGIHNALLPEAKIGLHPEEVTLAEVCKSKGYRTGMMGKWHLGDHPDFMPTRQGFDEYMGIPYSNDMWPAHPNNEAFKFNPLPFYQNDSIVAYYEKDQSDLVTRLTEGAVRFIETKSDTPFFLYVAHPLPHVPLFVSEKFRGKSGAGLYADVIMEIDWSVGEILQALKRTGVDKNTLVIFTSDNGPWLNYGAHAGSALPLREGKGTVLEGGVRVPCVMRWPGNIPAGATQDEPAMTIDILPTVASLIGATLPDRPIDGKDIRPLMTVTPGAQSPHDAYYFYYKDNELQGMRSGKWKLYFPHEYRSFEGKEGRSDGLPADYGQRAMGLELYDLESDISERYNVADRHPDVVRMLQDKAVGARSQLGDALTGVKGSEVRGPGRVGTAPGR